MREHIEHLHNAATTIQRYFKGFKYRMTIYHHIKLEVDDYNDRMATIIQKVWRGYLSRKYKFNYRGLQCWLEQIKDENAHVKTKLNEFSNETYEKAARCKQHYWDYIRYRLHHLLRTKAIPGIFSDQHSTELSLLEKCLKNVKCFRK